MQPSHNDRILAILCSVLDAHSAVLFLPDEVKTVGNDLPAYSIAAAFSLGDKLNYACRIHEGRGLAGWILRDREPLLVSNFDQRKNNLGYYIDGEEQHIKAFVGCAIPGGGVLCVDSKRQYSFSEKDQKLLHLFADLVAQLRAESEGEETRRQTSRFYAALRTVYALRRTHSRWAEFLRHFLDLMTTMTGFSYGVLCTRDPDGERYSVEGESAVLLQKSGRATPSYPMTNGVVGWVFRNSAPVMSDGPGGVPDTPLVGRGQDIPQFQTVMAVPLVIQRKTRGVLCLAHGTPMRVDEPAKDFVRMAAEHLALFLENLYIKCRLRDLHREMYPAEAPVIPHQE
jgi:GAF domain-containing protein